MPVMRDPYAGLPPAIRDALLTASTSPVGTTISTGKMIQDYLGKVLAPPKAAGPLRVRFSSADPQKGVARMIDANSGQQVESTLEQLRRLISNGGLAEELPKGVKEGQSVDTMVNRLLKMIGK